VHDRIGIDAGGINNPAGKKIAAIGADADHPAAFHQKILELRVQKNFDAVHDRVFSGSHGHLERIAHTAGACPQSATDFRVDQRLFFAHFSAADDLHARHTVFNSLLIEFFKCWEFLITDGYNKITRTFKSKIEFCGKLVPHRISAHVGNRLERTRLGIVARMNDG